MSTEQIIQLLIALVGGGTLGAVGKPILDKLLNRGKEQRDEWRDAIAQLQGELKAERDQRREEVKELKAEIASLKAELAASDQHADEWRGKYQEAQADRVRLEAELAVQKDENERCGAALQRLRAAVSCQYADNCPFILGRLATKESTTNEPGKNS